MLSVQNCESCLKNWLLIIVLTSLIESVDFTELPLFYDFFICCSLSLIKDSKSLQADSILTNSRLSLNDSCAFKPLCLISDLTMKSWFSGLDEPSKSFLGCSSFFSSFKKTLIFGVLYCCWINTGIRSFFSSSRRFF